MQILSKNIKICILVLFSYYAKLYMIKKMTIDYVYIKKRRDFNQNYFRWIVEEYTFT